MAENKTDYTKARMDLIKLLPEPLQSDVNLSLFDNIFNRYLTKQEVEKVAGYIGRGNPSALRSRQIHEQDVHRQAYQLQPIPYNKIGSIEHMTSWVDMQKELERLGVNIDQFSDWGATQKFNWVPPIDINKIINYRDYYWVDSEEPNSIPQYITIRSTCATATAKFNFWDGLIEQYGATFAINEILASDVTPTTYKITEFSSSPDSLKIEGDATLDILFGDFININSTTNNDGTYHVITTPTYSGVTNETTLVVDSAILAGSPIPNAVVSLRRFDKLVLTANTRLVGSPPSPVADTGDYTDLFTEGFTFFIRNTTNTDLNNAIVPALGSTYDAVNKETTVIIDYRVTDDTADGEISLEEQLSIFEVDMKCQCGDFGGWDISLWDDNPLEPLWGDDEDADGNLVPDGISDHANLITRISNAAAPVTGVGIDGELWYDTVENILYQATGSPVTWVVIWRNFSLLLDQTTGIDLWDLSLSCDTRPRITATEQWISQNHWFHKNDVDNFTSVQRANQPIIEYDWDLELNEWTYINYNWAYRSEDELAFEATTATPPRIELEKLIWWEHQAATGNEIIFDDRYGDMTDYFVEGREVFFVDDLLKTTYTVESSSYKTLPSSFPYRTYVTFTARPPEVSIGSPPTILHMTDANHPNPVSAEPIRTLQGDLWEGYGAHWLFVSADDNVPAPHQTINPYIAIDETQTPIAAYGAGSPPVADYELIEGSPPMNTLVFDYTTSLQAQNYLLNIDYSTFELLGTIPDVSTRPRTRKALFGYDDIRVYAADFAGNDVVREFGTYDEIGEVVFDIVGIDFTLNEFIIDSSTTNFDPSPYFASGSPQDIIKVQDNSGIEATLFTVIATSTNRIRVDEDIPIGTVADGNISNITIPIRPEAGIGFTNSKHVTVYVTGVEFFTPRPAGTNVRIIVGEASIDEIGTGIINVRMEESNEVYPTSGDIPFSATGYRVVEQIKTKTNQYPLFDIFTVLGTPTYRTNSIFGYKTSSESAINQAVGLRIVHDSVNDVYEFDQFLLDEDDGELFAYRDYANKQNDYWYNTETGVLKFWDEICWSDKTLMDIYYRRAIVSPVEPNEDERDIDGLYWYNTTTDTLFKRFTATNTWIEIPGVDRLVTDINLQTIWRAGKNNDLYIPAEVDWFRRSEVEYNTERNEFVANRVEEILATDNTITEVEAILQATSEWYENQANHISPTGVWVGDWEIPDPLYYNHLHENRKYLDSTELLTHFTSIINEQPQVPGWTGTKAGQFNIVHINDVNYALGGTIKEFNNGFDTLISSVMVNNVTPRSLIEFAHDQYEGLLNTIKEIYREDSVSVLSDVSVDSILNVSPVMADAIINIYELNDNTAFIYGDSTTFTDNDGINDLGVRNWIATLPYVNLVHRAVPERTLDDALGLNEVAHHDGHRDSYEITPATSVAISTILINTPDPRIETETLGISSTVLPANNIVEFEGEFSTISSREGVYWYYTTTNDLYRYVVAASGTQEPDATLPDGTLWMDLTTGLETLRVKRTDGVGVTFWAVVDGLSIGDGRLHNGTDPNDFRTATVSAWQLIDLDVILGDVIFELENRLYENAPADVATLNYDFATTIEDNTVQYLQHLNEAFLSYVSQSEIAEPFKNVNFDATNPFTWNYKRSTSGASNPIFEADDLTNSFVVLGNKTSSFAIWTYVNNSGNNNGTWKIISTVYDAGDDTTTIFVEGDVKDGTRGNIYFGILPSEITVGNPNNLNDGSESGGDWRDLYEKMYGTPYPHLEPWILQGYSSKPDYWDSAYENDDVHLWGDRTWKYKHGFDIVAVSTTDDTLSVAHEFVEVFVSSTVGAPPPISFKVDNSVTHQGDYTIRGLDIIQSVTPGVAGIANFIVDNAGSPPGFAAATYMPGMKIAIVDSTDTLTQTYIIKSTSLVGSNFTIVVEEEILAGDITPASDFINGAVYSPITDTTTIYIDSPIAADAPVDGRVAVRHGMWQNILIGRIPAGATYPNGVVSVSGIPSNDRLNHGLSAIDLPTFNYFSVNVDNIDVSSDGGITNFGPDAILPPYWDHTEMYGVVATTSIDTIVRSLYSDFSGEIIAPNANYVFNDRGPVEWEWKASSQYLYDQLTCSYKIDPANFVYETFGFNFTTIGELLIDRDTKNTASHTRTNFHGDVVNDAQFISNGLNQWYVNFNRYDGYDTNFSDFQSLWTLWTAPLTYQFASYIDTPSLSISHRYIDLTDFDYNITSKRSPGVDDFWLDALKIQILNIPYDISRYNNQLDWRFDVKTNITQSRTIEYYDVYNYQYRPNTSTNECTLYTWEIAAVDTFNGTFGIVGDHADIFKQGRQFTVFDSGNNGTYEIESSSYDTVAKLTTIVVTTQISSPTVDGIITLAYRTIPWETGAPVYLSTTESTPIPLDSDTVIGTTKYFIIKTSDTTFKIANTLADAQAGIEIPITTTGAGEQFVGELLSTFVVDTSEDVLWRQYAIDKTNVLSWSTPKQIQGMQHLVDIIRGYDALTSDSGWSINADNTLRDPETNAIITWQVEIERFIDYSYSTRIRRTSINDRYPVTVDYSTNEFTFNSTNNIFITADPVIVVSSSGILPAPLVRNVDYYVIRDSLDNFQLALSRTDAERSIAIDILPTTGVGELALSTSTAGKFLIPAFELNPFRNAVWFNQPSGIVSNIITGPVEDIRTSQLIFDQNGDTIEVDALSVYRRDTETKIIVNDAVNTQPEVSFVGSDYNFLHLGGLHIFTDSYEHTMLFNNYTAGDNLLYDPFIGLNVTKYEMLFNRNPEFTGRPNVGGYYLETFFNQGANIKENFEAGVENLRHAYDTYDTLESNLMTTHSRKALGYEGEKDYLTNLNVSKKSQFIFWRGQIQAKGSVNAIKAYINSRRFIDAKIDEFWAIKVAEFGSVGEKEYPEMFATTVDARSNEFKVEFIDNDDNGLNVGEGFTAIKMSDAARWYNQPEQVEVLRNNGKVMYFDMKIIAKMEAVGSPLAFPVAYDGNYIIHDMGVDAITMTNLGVDFTDFEYINPYVIKLTGSPLPNIDDLVIYGYVTNNDAENPSRLIDRLVDAQLSTIEYWDPARGNHYSNAIHNVDMQNENDPAVYITTPQVITDTRAWTDAFVGTSWMDTSTMDYIPYHSNKVITDDVIRFREWGQLYDYASINIYEWVESNIPPSSWDGVAETEAGNNAIPEDQRKSGTAKFTLFEYVGSPPEWIPLKNKVDTQYAASVPTGIFTVDLSVIDNTKAIDVYINERKQTSVQPVGSPAILPLTVSLTVKENDIVKFAQAIPTDADEIAAEIAAGKLSQEYEYTTVDEYDSLGGLSSKYYFWVSNKTTKPLDRNRLMSLAEAQQQLVTVPSAHMFFQKPLTATTNTEAGNQVNRIEYFVVAGSPHSYNLGLVAAEDTTVLVDIDGVDVDSDDIVVSTAGSPLVTTVTVMQPIGSPAPEEVKITYTGLYESNIALPARFSQVIIRGLQGIVFDDSRYTIRFTRDFTLRDNLDVVNEELTPLELNNLHEEWKIFRKEQDAKIDRWMWDRVTESMIGYKLDDVSVRVPSFEYELYDEKFGTDTQYGLNTNQAFVNGVLAVSTTIAYLIDPDVSFAPIDINIFFNSYSFDTPENIILSMDAIYDTFTVSNVNRIYFSILHDAFTTKAKYPGIFKTSMVSLHGIRPFQSSGVFDD